MNGLTLLLSASAIFLVGYFVYSKFLSRVLGIDPSRPTPAHTRQDGCDYVPAHPTVLFGHHFAAIAGAGPIVGPVLAAEFGWAAVTLWIVFGCVLIGAAHDMIALFLSEKGISPSRFSLKESVLSIISLSSSIYPNPSISLPSKKAGLYYLLWNKTAIDVIWVPFVCCPVR